MKALEKTIVLFPKDLGRDILATLVQRIKEKYENNVTKDDGYIFNIQDKIKIISNSISPSMCSETVFKIRFVADVLKPEVGTHFSGKIVMIDERGFFVSIAERMNVLVPASRLDDAFSFDRLKNEFLNEETKVRLKLGSEVNIELVAIRFDKKFNCIGKLN
jgi:DNA-directed RNA polymerase subunit E'/Rpb7